MHLIIHQQYIAYQPYISQLITQILTLILNSYLPRQTLLFASSWMPSSLNLMHPWQHNLDKVKELKS
jgi:hypothetical protein